MNSNPAALPVYNGEPAFSSTQIWLDVPYRDKDIAKKFGARWDAKARSWYAPAGVDLAPLVQWGSMQHPNEGDGFDNDYGEWENCLLD